ncbi:hypothetical protein [Scytonema sp. NUACC26]|uniref:hypothetical protein n=1 Tax=Scytonema sp. NUACC26 TaxID=3140176 RepID=UPI0038B2CE4C
MLGALECDRFGASRTRLIARSCGWAFFAANHAFSSDAIATQRFHIRKMQVQFGSMPIG